tara:strand:+ start:328 stop:513 length:186 start_codon:yes stop_codon:yes gene_type:complete
MWMGVKGHRSLTSKMNSVLYQLFKNSTAGSGKMLMELRMITSGLGSFENGRKKHLIPNSNI